ncbi:hypothetical protein LTR66_012611 [Elasticomyces elasticus]|nr:hypothetical protein LTR66_012611 [Elasticomyces elasticus]
MPFRFLVSRHPKAVTEDDAARHATAEPSSKRKALQEFFRASKFRKKRNGSKTKQPNSGPASHLPDFGGKSVDKEALSLILGAPKASTDITNTQTSRAMRLKQRVDSHTATPIVSPREGEQKRSNGLSTFDTTTLFAGAPIFEVDDYEHVSRPRVTFRGQALTVIESARDYTMLAHPTFASVTLDKRLLCGDNSAGRASPSGLDLSVVDTVEVPNMLSAQGLEPGTIGFENFLQLPIADSKSTGDEPDAHWKRQLLVQDPERLGIRSIDTEIIAQRLSDLNSVYQSLADSPTSCVSNEQKYVALHTHLFDKLLMPPLPAMTGKDEDYDGLQAQIESLERVLDITNLWYDFSLIEWRIRLGQLLWASHDDLDGREERRLEDRDLLLLQITLACELYCRLHLKKDSKPAFSAEGRSRKVQWDLVLARQCLDNVPITAKVPDKYTGGDRRSVWSAMSFVTAREEPDDSQVEAVFLPKNELQQLSGLLCFAESISWPHVSEVKAEMELKLTSNVDRPLSAIMNHYATPLATPRGVGQHDNYFDDLKRPTMNRGATAQSIQLSPSATTDKGTSDFSVGGWLSRSWLTGLVLPGEAASHFLISTLLENSPRAFESLGDSADLYGGFAYASRSYWSKSSVVGRVLAASRDARDCMGWISVPNHSTCSDGWIRFDVKDIPAPSEPRIHDPETVTRSSDPLHNQTVSSISPTDFVTPRDSPPVLGNEVRSHGISFASNGATSEPRIPNTTSSADAEAASFAQMTFSSLSNPKMAHLTIPLMHDVYFVSSHPCFPNPSPHRHSQTSDPCETNTLRAIDDANAEPDSPPAPAHPLHTDYSFDIVPVASLLSWSADEPTASLRTHMGAQAGEDQRTAVTDEGVLVLDCRGGADLELLARAWCARVGEHAVVGRVGRSCIGCCVREAGALGVRVVIRI